MKNVGLLMTKNEAPLLKETLQANIKFIKEIYVLDGGNDETEKIVKEFKEIKYYIHERDILPQLDICGVEKQGGRYLIKDGIRDVLFQEILKDCDVGDWITIMHGDEMFYHDPNKAAALASVASYNLIPWYSPHFFFTTDDLARWSEIKDKPLTERVTWYATNKQCYLEQRQFQILPDSHYDINTHSGVIPHSKNLKLLPLFPILKHYKVWNTDPDLYEGIYSEKYQRNVSREKGKWGLIHWEINSFEDFFVEYYPGYSEKHKFVDNFGRFEEPYNTMLKKFNEQLKADNLKLSDIIKNIPSQD